MKFSNKRLPVFLLSLFFVSQSFVLAQVIGDVAPDQASSGCVDLSYNLTYRKSKDANTEGQVSDLQAFLQDQGLLKVDPNGIFGPSTLKAVKLFQKNTDLLQSGYVGPVTRAKIKEVGCAGTVVATVTDTISSNIGSNRSRAGDVCAYGAKYSSVTGQACVTPTTEEKKVVACTMEARLCADGTVMPRDASCGWHPEKCKVVQTDVNQVVYITSNSSSATVPLNTVQQKIGSFEIQTGAGEDIVIDSVTVLTFGDLVNRSQLTNLTLKTGWNNSVTATPIGNLSATNTFAVAIPMPSVSSRPVAVYADVGLASAGLGAKLYYGITYHGVTSNVSKYVMTTYGGMVTVSGDQAAGGSVINPADITFVPQNSVVSQYIVGGQTSFTIGTFNIKATGGSTVIKDITVTVPVNTVESVTINGITAPVIGTIATLYNVGITTPTDVLGANIPVTVSLACINAVSGACAGVSGSDVNLKIINVTYNNGSLIKSVSPASAVTNTFKLVASKPEFIVSQGTGSVVSDGSFVKLMNLSVSADVAGDIKLKALPVTVSTKDYVSVSDVELRDSTGNMVIVGTGGINGSGNLTGSGVFTFTTPRIIAKGTTETFTVFGKITNTSNTDIYSGITSKLGLSSLIVWMDVMGGVTGLTGEFLAPNSYSSGSQTLTVKKPTVVATTCPMYTQVYCPNGTIISGGKDSNGCQLPSSCFVTVSTTTVTDIQPSCSVTLLSPARSTIHESTNFKITSSGVTEMKYLMNPEAAISKFSTLNGVHSFGVQILPVGTYSFTVWGSTATGATVYCSNNSKVDFQKFDSAAQVLGALTACLSLSRDIHRGDESQDTKNLQTFLFKKGLLTESVTGFYGDSTASAVKSYQISKNLPVTGMVYTFTRQAIEKDSCGD